MSSTTTTISATTAATPATTTVSTLLPVNFCGTADIQKDVHVLERFLPNGIGGVLTIRDDVSQPQCTWAVFA